MNEMMKWVCVKITALEGSEEGPKGKEPDT